MVPSGAYNDEKMKDAITGATSVGIRISTLTTLRIPGRR